MRTMAIDYGDVRTGVAVSDLTGLLVGDAFIIEERSEGRLAVRLAEETKKRGVTRLVVGHPLNMNGTRGPRAEKSEKLAALLREKTGLPVALWDERRTTTDAHRILHEAGSHGPKNKKKVDAVAAALILEGYLASV